MEQSLGVPINNDDPLEREQAQKFVKVFNRMIHTTENIYRMQRRTTVKLLIVTCCI